MTPSTGKLVTLMHLSEVSRDPLAEVLSEPLSQGLQVFPEGLARHLDASRQKLTPHCLAAIFDSQLPSPKLSLKMPPKLPLPHNRGQFLLFQNCPRGEGNCAAIERQKLSRGNFCLAASRCLSGPSGYLTQVRPRPIKWAFLRDPREARQLKP